MSITKRLPAQNTKSSNMNNPKSLFSISDVNRLYRREQTYKKKLKLLTETNLLLEQRIKIFQSTIKDERSTILFQLNQLSKTMNNKVSTYVDEKFDKDKFSDNQKAVETIKEMISKFQVVQRETKITKKVYQSLNAIHQRYKEYSGEINVLVKLTEKSNKEYEDSMKNMLNEKQNQIMLKRQLNQDIFDSTQIAIKKIDDYETQRLKLIDEEKELQKYVQKLNKIQNQTNLEVQKFTQWAEIVIDKNHRKVFNKETKEKDFQLTSIQDNNKRLEVYFKELQNQEELIKSQLYQKENEFTATQTQKMAISTKSKINKSVTDNCIQLQKTRSKFC